MFCRNCGKEIPDDAEFCPECGTETAAGAVQSAGGTQDSIGNENSMEGNMLPAVGAVGMGNGKYPVDANRNLAMYILLSIVTCGIYKYYFLYRLAADVNIICDGDGKQTAGLLQYILFSIITCGIYSWIWYYSLGNRLSENAPRYGLQFAENGTTVLLWKIFGVLLCAIGPLIAMNIIIKNTNALANAYNAN